MGRLAGQVLPIPMTTTPPQAKGRVWFSKNLPAVQTSQTAFA
jgi:hypothetical protein